MWNASLQVNMCDVLHRYIPQWKKNLYYITYDLIREINNRWVGNSHDLVIQFACMDTNSYVQIHRDKNVSS